MQEILNRDETLTTGGSSVDRSAADGFPQAREYYRVDLEAPVEWQLLDAIGQELDTHAGEATNLSGGGLAFKSDCAAAPGDRMHITLTGLPLIETLDTYVTVLRVTPLATEDETIIWQMACQLDELTPNMRDRLVSCIFEQQRLAIFNARQEQEQALSHAN